jgi:hypothetical protein
MASSRYRDCLKRRRKLSVGNAEREGRHEMLEAKEIKGKQGRIKSERNART